MSTEAKLGGVGFLTILVVACSYMSGVESGYEVGRAKEVLRFDEPSAIVIKDGREQKQYFFQQKDGSYKTTEQLEKQIVEEIKESGKGLTGKLDSQIK